VGHAVRTLASRGVQHGALVALDNRTGEILAWVGSPDFWSDTAGQVDMVVSRRQPGSALKPFLYALALDRGYTPASSLPDVASTYDTPTGPYRPRNYDRVFHGPVRLRDALASSFNVPAVELAHRLGPSPFLRTLHAAGFASLDRGADHYGIGLALGNGDVTLLEVANAYRALVNRGVWRPVRWVLAPAGAPVAEQERRVVSAAAAALILDILSDPAARVPGFGLVTPFDFPFPAAVKTGTSRNFTDNWAVAVTQGFTIAVWVGNFSGRPMRGVSGVSGAGPLLQRAVLMTARRYAPGVFATPGDLGARSTEVCALSGMRPGTYCPRVVEWLLPSTAPTDTCSWHRHDGTVVLPPRYAEWATHYAADPAWDGRREAVATALGDAGRRFRIIAPQDGDRYTVPPGVDPHYATIALRATGGGANVVRWFVDGRPLSKPRWQLQAGTHIIRAETGSGEVHEVRVVVERQDVGGLWSSRQP
jgi:penicillin-binding protein 1C